MNGFIYKITNKVNGKVYIGQTHFTVEYRFRQHLKNFNIEHRQQPLYKAFAKYGIDNFTVETLEEVEHSKLNEREMYWIAYYDSFRNGYNANLGGNGNLYIWTDNEYEEIRTLYLSGFTIKKIAELYKVSRSTIASILHSMKVKIRRHPMDMNDYEAKEVIQSYYTGTSIKSIAKKYNTDSETVKRFLISKKINLKKRYLILEDKEAHKSIIRDFYKGVRFKDLEIKYHSDIRTIKKILVMYGIDPKLYRGYTQNYKGALCLSEEQCLSLIIDYKDNLISLKEIAIKYHINLSTLYKVLDLYHIKYQRHNRPKSVQSLKD